MSVFEYYAPSHALFGFGCIEGILRRNPEEKFE